MNARTVSRLLPIALALSLDACQAGTPPSASVAAAATPAATPTAKPLGEHVTAEWQATSPAEIFIGVDAVWVAGHGVGAPPARIDPTSNELTFVKSDLAERTPVPSGFGSLWVATPDNQLNRVDPTTGKVTASIVLSDAVQDIRNGVLVTDSAVWVVLNDKAELVRIDPATNRVASKTAWAKLIEEALEHASVPVGMGTDFLWLQMAGDEGGGGGQKGLLRLDPTSGAGLTFLPYVADQNGDGSPTITDKAVWYGAGGRIYRIDVATNTISASYATAPGILHMGVGFGSVWLSNYDTGIVQRLDVGL